MFSEVASAMAAYGDMRSGRAFAGRVITADTVSLQDYLARFPAVAALV